MTAPENKRDSAAGTVWPNGPDTVWSPYRNQDEPRWSEPPPRAAAAPEAAPQDPAHHALVFAGRMAHEGFPRGDLAELRRLDIAAPDAPAYYRWMVEKELNGNPWRERKWALILYGLAHMTRNGGTFEERCAHDLDTPVGRALYYGGKPPGGSPFYSAQRLNSLLRAGSATHERQLMMLFRRCGSQRIRFNWWEMARYILYTKPDGSASQRGRRRLAFEYYRAEDQAVWRETQDQTNVRAL